MSAPGTAGILPADVFQSGSDNCGMVNLVSAIPNSFTCSNLGGNLVTLLVNDGHGNTKTCSATVTVVDYSDPSAMCQNITRNVNANGQASIVPADVFGGGSDNCGVSSLVSVTPNSFTCSNLGANPVTLTVSDGHGNSVTCTALVTIQDITQPSVVCKNHTVALDANGQAGIVPANVFQSGSDNCGTVNLVSVSPNSFTCSNLGSNTVTLTVNDGNGNVNTCTASVMVQDNSLPTVVCKNHTIALGANGTAGIVPIDVFQSGGDNCGAPTLVSVLPNSFNCNDLGGNTVTLLVTDGHGNFAQCTAIVTVQDLISPTAVCKNATVYLNANGTAGIVSAMVNDGSNDNCGVSLSLNNSSFGCANVGANTVTLTATDPSGNANSCSATVTVVDNLPPIALCKNASVFLDASGQASVTTAQINNNSTDNCGIESMSVSPNSFVCSNLGSNTVSLTVSDVNGNTSICTATVTVVDNLPPTLVCQDITIALDATGNANITTTQVFDAAASSDNCGSIHLVSVNPHQFDCGEVGENTVTLLADDTHGNSATCQATVTVLDFITNIDVQVTPENCGMSNGSIVVTADIPAGQAAFSINGGASWQLTGVFSNLPAGTYVVVIQAYGTLGCTTAPMPTVVQSSGNTQTWYKDVDGDGYSDGVTQQGCTAPDENFYLAGDLIDTDGDCNDYDATQFPGQIWYKDVDDDDYSDGVTLVQCDQPWGGDWKSAGELIDTDGDCDDSRNYCYPGAPELCNNRDDDCDGSVDEGLSNLTYVGNVTFTNQAAVNAWSSCYTVIQGNLMIQNAGIDSLASLGNLQKVTGNVTIKTSGLDSLSWLLNLDTIGGILTVTQNSQLATLHGLESLTRVGGNLKIHQNFELTSCCAIYDLLNSATGIGGTTSIFYNETGCDNVAEINEECEGSSNLIAPPGCVDCPAVPESLFLQEKQAIVVFPNPASEVAHIRIQQAFTTGKIRLSSLEGRVILQEELEAGTLEYRLKLQELPAGIYYVQVLMDGESFRRKLYVE